MHTYDEIAENYRDLTDKVPVPVKRTDRKLEAQEGKPLEDNPKPVIPDRWLVK